MNRGILALTALAVLATGTTTRAETPVEVGVFGGWHVLDPYNAFGVEGGDPLRGPGGDWTLGVRGGVDVLTWLALEAELNLIPDDESRAFRDDKIFLTSWRAHALIPIVQSSARRARIFVVLGGGGMFGGDSSEGAIAGDNQFALHTGLGARMPLSDQFGLRLDYRMIFSPSIQKDRTPLDHVFTLGLYYVFGETAAAPAEAKAEEPAKPSDSDGDGIVDDDDKCPNQAENKNGIDDDDGCPETDEDGDGLIGSKDRCPSEAEDKDNFEDGDGCPDPDNDDDGVKDADDKCPQEKENRNGYKDGDGCADEIPAAVSKFTGAIKGITFVTGSAKIAASSNKTLDQAAQVLVDNTSVRLEIQGHTDDVGSREKNMTLSQARADAVRDYLVKKGVEESRLKAVGYGPDKPVDSAKTAAARAKNRRVEFMIMTE